MDASHLAAARTALVDARRRARTASPWPAAWLPEDVASAYRLQAAVAEGLGAVAGWKIAAVTEAQRAALGVDRPLAAPVAAAWLRDIDRAPAEFRLALFIAPRLECEFAFELGRDLPARPGRPYSRAEVVAAVADMRLAIEVVDSRLPPGSGTLAELADAFNHGALVCGRRVPGWQGLDFAATRIVLHVLGEEAGSAAGELALGSGAAILDGDPFGTVVMLANAQPLGGAGLRAGHVVTTGSCTGAPPVPGPGRYRAGSPGSAASRCASSPYRRQPIRTSPSRKRRALST